MLEIAHVPAADEHGVRARAELLKQAPVARVRDGRRDAAFRGLGIRQRDAAVEARDVVRIDEGPCAFGGRRERRSQIEPL